MKNIAKTTEPLQPFLEYGRVEIDTEGALYVQCAYGPVTAVPAASCLVEPRAGDKVLVSLDESGSAYILSILEHESDSVAPTRITFDSQVEMRVNNGGLILSADADVSLASGAKMNMAADQIAVCADKGDVVVRRMSFSARALKSTVKRISIVADKVENSFRRLTQRLQDTFRYVENQEEVQAGNTRYLVADTLTMNAKNSIHMAEEVVTINAEQVHLG